MAGQLKMATVSVASTRFPERIAVKRLGCYPMLSRIRAEAEPGSCCLKRMPAMSPSLAPPPRMDVPLSQRPVSPRLAKGKPHVVATNQSLLDRTLAEAEGYLELGMTEHALAALQRRGKLVHGSGRGCYLLGETLRELTRFHEAIYPLKRSAALLPDDIHVWLALGWCYKRTGQLDQAIGALQEALAYEPGEAILHYNLACYWSLSGDRSHAMDHLTKSLHIDGNYRDLIADEPDFEFLRGDHGFQLLTSLIY